MNDLDSIKTMAKAARDQSDSYEVRLLARAVLELIYHIERNEALANLELKERVGS